MANEGDRKKSSRKKTSSKRIADAVEQAKQASQARPEPQPPIAPEEPEIPLAEPSMPEPEPIVEVRETATVVEQVETTHADAQPLLGIEPVPEGLAEVPDHPPEALSFAERASCFIGDVQRLAAEYIDASEEFACRLLEIQNEAATMAEGTALERLLRTQNSIGLRIVESSARAARRLWRVDRDGEARV